MHVPVLEGRRTRLTGSGAGLLIGVDCEDELSAMLVNPLTRDSSALPPLPDWWRVSFTYGFVTGPKVSGEEDVFVVIYSLWWPIGQERLYFVALWRCGDPGGWATIPSQKFFSMMPQYRRRLTEHGPKVLQDELAAAAGSVNGDKALVPGMESAYLIEHEGQVSFFSRHEIYTAGLPRVTFELHDVLGDNWASLVNWVHAPELRDKILLKSRGDTSCYVLTASDDLVGLGLSKNCIYFLSH
ncbi:hypothetical protein BAE44_0018008, partial [Dichanthelium oligosanthes]